MYDNEIHTRTRQGGNLIESNKKQQITNESIYCISEMREHIQRTKPNANLTANLNLLVKQAQIGRTHIQIVRHTLIKTYVRVQMK